MSQPHLNLGRIFRAYAATYLASYPASPQQLKVIGAIQQCRTSALGGHARACTSCGSIQVHYNSFVNRHCPQCQAFEKEKWVEARQAELLPVPYLHMVFTLPHELNPLVRSNDRLLYNLLFKAAWSCIRKISADTKWLGAQSGMIAVLHTWGSNLSLHPHLHCIIPSGGMDLKEQKWISTRKKGYLAPNKKVLSPIFRGYFLCYLREAIEKEQLQYHGQAKVYKTFSALRHLFQQLQNKSWNVYAKCPIGGPQQIV